MFDTWLRWRSLFGYNNYHCRKLRPRSKHKLHSKQGQTQHHQCQSHTLNTRQQHETTMAQLTITGWADTVRTISPCRIRPSGGHRAPRPSNPGVYKTVDLLFTQPIHHVQFHQPQHEVIHATRQARQKQKSKVCARPPRPQH